jgi:hypothetical protein
MNYTQLKIMTCYLAYIGRRSVYFATAWKAATRENFFVNLSALLHVGVYGLVWFIPVAPTWNIGHP